MKTNTPDNAIRRALAACFALFAFVLAVSCPGPLDPSNPVTARTGVGSLKVTSQSKDIQQAASRSISPAAIPADTLQYSFSLERSGYATIEAGPFDYSAEGYSFDNVDIGTWTLTAQAARTTSPNVVMFRGQASVTITEGINSFTITLNLLRQGTGSFDFNLSFPQSLVDGYSVQWKTGSFENAWTTPPFSIPMYNPNIGNIYIPSTPLSSGNYYLWIKLKKGGVTVADVIELVEIYDNQFSTKTITLDASKISQPPAAPSGLSVSSVRDPESAALEAFRVSWEDNAVTETSYLLQRFENGINTLTVTLPPGTTSYNDTGTSPSLSGGAELRYAVSAVNTIGSSTQAIVSRNAYSLHFARNGGTGNLPNEDPVVFLEGESMYIPGNTGGLRGPAVNGHPALTQRFLGWDTLVAGSINYMPGQNLIVSAQWNDSNQAVGQIGPAGGSVFYDKGSVTDGWRYLEAAPVWQARIEDAVPWSNALPNTLMGTGNGYGMGKINTAKMTAQTGYDPGVRSAVSVCENLEIGGYNDWYLPSEQELLMLLQNRVALGFGENAPPESTCSWDHWSSTEMNADEVYGYYHYGPDYMSPDQFVWNKSVFPAPPAAQGRGVRAIRSFEDVSSKLYAVAYHPNGAIGNAPIDSIHYQSGLQPQAQSPGSLSRPEFSFGGWALNPQGTGTIYQPDDYLPNLTDNLVLYAVWL